MKKLFTLLLTICSVLTAFGQTNYCQVVVDNACTNSYITSVTLSNVSVTDGLCDIDQTGTDDGYSDYSANVATLDPDVPSLLTVTLDGLFTDAVIAYIDWDGSGTWETDELIPLIGESTGTNAFTAVIVAPTDAKLDSTIIGGIRIQAEFLTPNTGPCVNNLYGEVEDYSFIVTAVAAPPGTPTGYCAASGPADCSTAFVAITEFVFENLTNTSTACAAGAGPTYTDFTSLTADYTLGSDVVANITIDAALGTEAADIYIDWNMDGDFDDVGETFNGVNVAGDATVAIAGAVVPAGTVQGTTRMRVRVYDPAFEPGPAGPCGATGDGEVEDYTLKIIDPDAIQCATLISPTYGQIDVCTTSDLVWNSVTDAVNYEVVLTYANGDTVSNILVNDTTFTMLNLLPDSVYNWSIFPRDSNNVKAVGCAIQSFTTTPFAKPTLAFAQDTVSFCEGLGTTLMPIVTGGNGTLSFDWSGDNSFLDDFLVENPVFTDTTFGVYTLYLDVNDSLSCGVRDSIKIQVFEAPELTSFNFSSLTICPGDSVGVQVVTSNPISFFDLKNGVYTELTPSSISSSIIYFNAMDTSYIFNAVVNTAMCQDTILMDTVNFIGAVDQPVITSEFPVVGPCVGDSVLVIANNYSNNLMWSTGSTNDSIYVFAASDVAVEYTFANGLCSIVSDTITIDFDAYPAKPILTADQTVFCEGDSARVLHNATGTFVWNDGDFLNTSRTFYDSDSLFVMATSPLGCSTTSDTLVLIKNANPVKPIFSISGIVGQLCEGQAITAFTSNTNTLNWSTGESTASIIVDMDTDLFLTVTNAEMCSSTSDTLTLVFGAQPARPIINKIEGPVTDSLQCSIVGATYTWYYESQPLAATTRTIPLNQAGLYRVNVTTVNGCVSDLSPGFTNVGIEDALAAGVRLITTDNEWVIVSDNALSNNRLMDLSGKLLFSYPEGNEVHISRSNYNGLMLFQTEMNGQRFTIKLK